MWQARGQTIDQIVLLILPPRYACARGEALRQGRVIATILAHLEKAAPDPKTDLGRRSGSGAGLIGPVAKVGIDTR